jgi:CRP/FNR family transcriptional regulator, anaerobic regulatory protein
MLRTAIFADRIVFRQDPHMASKKVNRSHATPCHNCPLRKVPHFRAFEKAELAFVQSFKSGELAAQAGTTVLLDGNNSPHLFTVLKGWLVRYKSLPDGKRQVLNFAIPGDLLGLQSSLFDHMTHSVAALSDVTLCVFPRERIWELYKGYPGLAFDITWLASREESILAEHLVNVGQRPAFARIAYMIIYLFERARRAGLVDKNTLVLPVTQEHLADAMGLSIVHTNKTLQRLRATGWLSWRRQELIIYDRPKLMAIAEYDPVERPMRPFL